MRIPNTLRQMASVLAICVLSLTSVSCRVVEKATGIPLRSDADRAAEVQTLRSEEEAAKRELDEMLLLEGYFAGEEEGVTSGTKEASLNAAGRGQLMKLEVIAEEASGRAEDKYKSWLLDRAAHFKSDRELIDAAGDGKAGTRAHRDLRIVREDHRKAGELRLAAQTRLQLVTTQIENAGGKGQYTDYLGTAEQTVNTANRAGKVWTAGQQIFGVH